MKINKILMGLGAVAALSLGACSNDEPTNAGNNGDEMKTSFISVQLLSPDGSLSRAEFAGFEDGSKAENQVDKVRFYFFTESGAPANVKLQGQEYVNYYDWTPESQTYPAPEKDNIESILGATIVISTPNGDKLPRLMAAVINPTETTVQSRSLQQLKDLTNDYAKSSLTVSGKFVMFNSVYEENGQEVCAVPISADNLATTAELAIANPVNIYVERNVAKVGVSFSSDAKDIANGNMLKLKDKKGNDLTVGGNQVYLKVNGWKLTAVTDRGRLGKDINPEWGMDWWNRPANHRSYWAINAPSAINNYFSYNNISETPIDASLYTNENAEDYTNNSGQTTNLYRTKVILAGTICDENGDGLTIVRHLGAHFADTFSEDETENLKLLKANILSQLAANGNYYYYKEGDEFKQIGVKDLKIVTVELDPVENEKAHDCYVYAQLSDEAMAKTWYTPKDGVENPTYEDEAVEIVAANVINDALAADNIDKALVWKEGMTYYYFEIVHNGIGETATKGVVRNHVYKTNVTNIAGLGTPVYDPNQLIYPEKPDPNEHFIAAQINILSWRVVKHDYSLEW